MLRPGRVSWKGRRVLAATTALGLVAVLLAGTAHGFLHRHSESSVAGFDGEPHGCDATHLHRAGSAPHECPLCHLPAPRSTPQPSTLTPSPSALVAGSMRAVVALRAEPRPSGACSPRGPPRA